MTKTRDEILGQWERQPLDRFTYYAHCRSGQGVDTFVIGEDRIGWRNVGISAFIFSKSGLGPRTKGRQWKQGMLIFPAGLFTAEDIQICLATNNP